MVTVSLKGGGGIIRWTGCSQILSPGSWLHKSQLGVSGRVLILRALAFGLFCCYFNSTVGCRQITYLLWPAASSCAK